MHNIINGTRILTPEMGDRILKCLRWSLLELLEPEELLGHATRILGDLAPARETAVLTERLGPGYKWSGAESPFERFTVECHRLAAAVNPVVARLAEDPRLAPLLQGGDLVLLDRSEERRRQPEPDELYAVDHGGEALVRGVRLGTEKVYLVAPDCRNRPEKWEMVCIRKTDLPRYVIARIIPLPSTPSPQFQRGARMASR
jgi:hypothetical protein